VTLLGLAIGALGVGLAVRSLMLVSGRGRPRRGARPALVLAGPYLRTRNPMLLGLVVAFAGVALAASDGWFGLLAALVAGGGHVWVTRVEEPRLLARFGDFYAAYRERVPRWLPAVGRPGAAERLTGEG
jgi:protein-S-isoprenylcysteine O-methyltransferase Ste14